MKEEHSFCVGCGKGFYLTDKNSGPTVGSPEYYTLCHRRCCGSSTRCITCSIFLEKRRLMQRQAIKSLMNILVVALQQMDDSMLNALQDKANLNLTSLIGAELDKRSGVIRNYTWFVNTEDRVVLTVEVYTGEE